MIYFVPYSVKNLELILRSQLMLNIIIKYLTNCSRTTRSPSTTLLFAFVYNELQNTGKVFITYQISQKGVQIGQPGMIFRSEFRSAITQVCYKKKAIYDKHQLFAVILFIILYRTLFLQFDLDKQLQLKNTFTLVMYFVLGIQETTKS